MTKLKKEKIIIIGAGVAGMSAAQILQNKGFEVVILEGLNRVGGRVFPILLGENYVDSGATWIHLLDGNPLTAFAKMNDWEIVEDTYEPFEIWNSETKKWLNNERFSLMEFSEEIRTAAIDFFLNNKTAVSAADFFNTYIADKNWDKQTIQIVKFLYATLLETDYGGNIGEIALIDERYLNKFNKEEENDGLIVGSFKKLIDELKKGLNIEFNQEVKKI